MDKSVNSVRKYVKILLKLSGEALSGDKGFGFDEKKIEFFANEIISITKLGIKVGIVVGGGNIFRGLKGTKKGFDRIKGDYMGMLATTINALAIEGVLNSLGQKAKVLTSTFMEPYAERYNRERALKYLDEGYVVIFSGGTSNPFFTTDSAAALRAIEIGADVLLKGTNVDAVYSEDPKINPNAEKFEIIDFQKVIDLRLKVMDLTAFTLCYENNMPIIVFDIHKKGNLEKIIKGEKVGTLIK